LVVFLVTLVLFFKLQKELKKIYDIQNQRLIRYSMLGYITVFVFSWILFGILAIIAVALNNTNAETSKNVFNAGVQFSVLQGFGNAIVFIAGRFIAKRYQT